MISVKTLFKSLIKYITRCLILARGYWLAPTKSVTPLSTHFGYDRGTPIDRYWIEDFLKVNETDITGVCLEVTDSTYIKKYGKKVVVTDVIDIEKTNDKATIYGDLRNLKSQIKDNTYDCIILTHVLGLIDDVDSALSECKRILKPKGVILATSACLSPTYDTKSNFWRFTPNGARYLFSKYFSDKDLTITSYGNVLAGQCFWVGMSQEDLTLEELKYNDPKFPCIVAIRAVKDGGVCE